jgi:hypothetical protein
LPEAVMPGFRVVSIHTEINSTQRRKERKEIYQQNFLQLCALCVFALKMAWINEQ